MAKLPKSGRTPKFTEEIKDIVSEKIKSNCELQKIVSEISNVAIDQSTISRHLSELGSYKYPISVPLISPKNLEKRLDYATAHQLDNFDDVIFSDESCFELNKSSHKVFVFKGAPTPDIKQTNDKIMIWGSISRRGKINMTFVEGIIDKFKYIEI